MKFPVLAVLLLAGCAHTGAGEPLQTRWRLDNLESIGGVTPEVLGAPKVVADEARKALCFDGKSDGIFLPLNPVQGWARFTIEVLMRPDGDGPPEQRFLHIQDEAERRVLIETRVTQEHTWSLDTFLRATEADKLTLLDRKQVQSTDRWFWVALVYDGKTMSHHVDGAKQLEGELAFPASRAGRISLGVRQNRIHWFKGCIAEVRFTSDALSGRALQRPN
ncbi:MAG TPA: LamG-like jellyroll fold domain-containing protein [Steroidobacteraceae bacterium]|jgi:hypothetical protein